jgi:tetratricopeptide (TPR) repeat protein
MSMTRLAAPVIVAWGIAVWGFSAAAWAQPAGLGRPQFPEDAPPTDLDSFAKARAKAKARLDLQEKRVQAAGPQVEARTRAVLEAAHASWELAQLCIDETSSEAFEKAPDGEEKTALETELETCSKQNRQKTLDLLEGLLHGGEGAAFFPAADEAWFYLAWYELQAGQHKAGEGHLKTLLEKFPESDYAPEGWLLLAEYYFELSAITKAVEAYKRVTLDRKNRLYPFALYKLAWCHFNLSEFQVALEELVAAVGAARESPHWGSLVVEARSSVPRFFAEIGKPEAAFEFFRKVDKDSTERMLASLALIYEEQGSWEKCILVCRRLLEGYPGSEKAVGYRLLIARSFGALGKPDELAAEVEALAEAAAAGGCAPALKEEAKLELDSWIARYEKEKLPGQDTLLSRLRAARNLLER